MASNKVHLRISNKILVKSKNLKRCCFFCLKFKQKIPIIEPIIKLTIILSNSYNENK